jgi:AraC-like DNA-binding protein
MPIVSSGRVFTDGDSLPALQQVVAGGRLQETAPGYMGVQPSSERPDPSAAGFEQRDGVFTVELRSYGGGLPEASLRRVLEHMQAHLDQQLPVTALAALAQMSPSTSAGCSSTGLSPHQYLLRQRIERAQELLADPGCRVAQVSYELGFPHQSHFPTVFRKLAGVTPRTYQRQRNSK